ncbi:MAG: D-alanyl-D-alanine carboxypeptidase-like protein, partial [Firmicutes bacterium]|nr:D-alanyl-D-alanine carboxypeptidase-like protein [Bacillota bacterium]
VPTGTTFDVVNAGPEWSQVMLPKGRTGWVSTPLTNPVAPRQEAASTAQLAAGPTAYIQVQGGCVGSASMINDQLYVPLRPTMAQLGGEVTGTAQQVEAHFRGRGVALPAGSVRQAGQELFVPARTLADGLGLSFTWDDFRHTGELTVPGMAATSDLTCSPGAGLSAYVIMDAHTGVILSEQRADTPRKIASTTKIMTALLAVERGNPESIATVSRNAASQICTCMGLHTGDRVALKHLLYGMIIPSGNDAAVTIAELLSGSESAFARQMNLRAVELGATSTHFISASGLDDYTNPYSTARDLALISRAAMRNPEFRTIVDTTAYSFYGPRGKMTVTSHNDFLLKYPDATGMKNGWTEKAGYTLVTSAYRGGRELIVVMLGAPTRDGVYAQATRLMDYGFKLADASWALK